MGIIYFLFPYTSIVRVAGYNNSAYLAVSVDNVCSLFCRLLVTLVDLDREWYWTDLLRYPSNLFASLRIWVSNLFCVCRI